MAQHERYLYTLTHASQGNPRCAFVHSILMLYVIKKAKHGAQRIGEYEFFFTQL